MSARYIVGDSLDVLKKLPDDSVDLVMSSPPFLALRSYLPADHPDKDKEIGGEVDPGEFIDALLDIVEECDRVLAPHGSLCFELGDTYSGSGGAGGDYADDGLRAGQAPFTGSARQARSRSDGGRYANGYSGGSLGNDVTASNGGFADRPKNGGPGWPLAKSLCMIPELFRVSLVYGLNPLTGRPTPRWRARNVIRWVRPNPPVGALGDKFRPATSEMVVVCKSDKRYFDLDAVRTPGDYDRPNLKGQGSRAADSNVPGQRRNMADHTCNPAGVPPLDWWSISTSGYPGAHYAVYPPELCIKPIKAMCPTKVCTVCGEPWHRGAWASKSGIDWADIIAPNCDHDDLYESSGNTRNGVVLDPFAGSGTTLMVALGHGRDAIGIDLDSRNADLAVERCGMWLTVENGQKEQA